MRLTQHQKALLSDLEDVFPTGRVPVGNVFFADHSLRTARSLERKGWLTLEEDAGGVYATFSSDNYADWLEFKHPETEED
ncbi:hypothetical protein [Methylobacter marinus]|uniref:hypothetical protein n=1 Tax=Methylobacter marinus TaxID=34058 RepID=UPI0012EB5BF1|nr:hypothetical protein [Methylobacter marinus]